MIFCERREVGTHFKGINLPGTLENWMRKRQPAHSCATNATPSKASCREVAYIHCCKDMMKELSS